MDLFSLLSFGNAGWGDELLSGLLVTIKLSLVTLPFGMIIGLIVSTSSLRDSKWGNRLSRSYVVIFRGLPEVLTLFLVYNGVSVILNQISHAINPEGGFVELSPFIAGVVALGLVFGAYSSEVLRGAFQALDKGQAEAGYAVGMSEILVFYRIKLPQVWRFALPGLGNLWVNLIKDTALVSIIALDDLMRAGYVAVRFTKEPFTFYLTICIVYWLLCLSSEFVLARMEARVNRGISRGSCR